MVYSGKREMFCFKEQARPYEACGNDVYRIFHVDLGQYLPPEPDLMRQEARLSVGRLWYWGAVPLIRDTRLMAETREIL